MIINSKQYILILLQNKQLPFFSHCPSSWYASFSSSTTYLSFFSSPFFSCFFLPPPPPPSPSPLPPPSLLLLPASFFLCQIINNIFFITFGYAVPQFGTNISPLTVEISHQTNERLHVKIYDPNNQRWEVPTK